MTRAIDVVSDANVALKWFHSDGEEEVDKSRALLDGQRNRTIALRMLDLTPYEVGNALLRGGPSADAKSVAEVLRALVEICPPLTPAPRELESAALLAEKHNLTLYDAAYAAVAQSHGAQLATLDRALLAAGLGVRPSELLADRADSRQG